MLAFEWPLSKGISAELEIYGEDVKAEDLDRLKAYLEHTKQQMDLLKVGGAETLEDSRDEDE